MRIDSPRKPDYMPFHYVRRLPCTRLSSFVQYYYLFEVGDNAQLLYPELMTPHSHHSLILHYGEIPYMWSRKASREQVSPATLHGVLTIRHEFTMQPGLRCAGIFFRGDGLFRLFGLPMPELTDMIFDFRLFDNAGINALIDTLKQAATDQKRFAGIESYLLNRLENASPVIPLMQIIINRMTASGGRVTVQELCNDYKVSRQYIYRMFRDRIGLNPKTFGKLIRFNRVLGLLKKDRDTDWQEIVYKCGYYDQSHIVKDF